MLPKKKKKAKNKIISTLLLVLIALLIAYVLYSVVALIAVPSDSVIVEKGMISLEESTVRIYYKRWKNSKRRQSGRYNI